jgi:hypothetical protein
MFNKQLDESNILMYCFGEIVSFLPPLTVNSRLGAELRFEQSTIPPE